ncbi:right-handed parallel beta-helix repeat-containing protein [Antarcticimicrobium luteum]|uniref:Uncharacterized protein n=1 Tax=Antarcticimicrobium luteum TaxID=2547397 RepID=A0A4R5VE35_9RHOB|nr:right-handed parallel beta-helix repeat-containing protein [Antarcticimicrobium luteum]TDK50649.1 hypothetical protein E1832_05475 [Antarcticimicrobium luteum]
MIELFKGKKFLGSYATIQDAVNAADEGNTIRLGAGTFSETVTVDKAVNFEGAGDGQTIMDGTGLGGSGLHLVGDLGSKAKIEIEGITFRDFAVAGVDFDDDAILKTLEIEDSHFVDNGINGVRIGGDYDPVALDKVEIEDSSFENNGNGTNNGDGDILFFQYYGDAKIEDVSITGGGTGDNGIQFRGDDGPVGKVELKDVTIEGAYAKTGIAVYNFANGDGLRFKDTVVTALAGWGKPVVIDDVGGKIDAHGLETNGAPGLVELAGNGGANNIRAGDGASILAGKGGDDKLRGGDGDDLLAGGDGDDRMSGGKGDDGFDGGAGNDRIDGGKGIDIASYSGSVGDYDLAFKGHDKIVVTDLRAGSPDGVDQLKKIEILHFTAGTPALEDDIWLNTDPGTTLAIGAELDPSARTPGGTMLVGSGIPADDFAVVRSAEAGVELGLSVIYRQGPSVDAVGVNGDGSVQYIVNDGPQSTVNGSFADNAGRAAWSFQYSIATGLEGESTDLSDFTFTLSIDVDPGEDTDFRVLTMVDPGVPLGNDTGFLWLDPEGAPVIGDDGGNANVAQNSENFAFGFIEDYIDADPLTAGIQDYSDAGFPEGEFDIRLSAYDSGGALIAQNTIAVDVFDFV